MLEFTYSNKDGYSCCVLSQRKNSIEDCPIRTGRITEEQIINDILSVVDLFFAERHADRITMELLNLS